MKITNSRSMNSSETTNLPCTDFDRNRNRNRDFSRITGYIDTVWSGVSLLLCTLAIISEWLCNEDFPMKDPIVRFAVSMFPRNEITRDFELPEMKPFAMAAQVSLFLMYSCRLVAAYSLLTGTCINIARGLQLISCKLWMKTAVLLIGISTAVLLYFTNHHNHPTSHLHQCLLITELVFRSLGLYYVAQFVCDIKIEEKDQDMRQAILFKIRQERTLAGREEISLIYKFNTEQRSSTIKNKNNNNINNFNDSEANVRVISNENVSDPEHGNVAMGVKIHDRAHCKTNTTPNPLTNYECESDLDLESQTRF